VVRGHDELLVVHGPTEPGEVVEQLGQVAADGGIGGEQTQILVDRGRLGVVVARADVAVAAQAVALLAHDEQGLGVGLQADEAVDDVDADLLERLGPLDVAGLVEAGLQLHEHGDLLARLGGPDEGADDRAVAGRAVQRRLDGDDLVVGGGLGQEGLDGVVEAGVGVVDEDVVAPHLGEEVRRGVVVLDQPGLGDPLPGRVLQVTSVQAVQHPEPGEVERSDDLVDVVVGDVELAHQQVAQLLAHGGLDLEAHGPPEPAAAQLDLDGGQQIVRFVLLEREIGVARHPEGRELHDVHPGEQLVEVGGDDLLERHERGR
jgi:hypothetical protein